MRQIVQTNHWDWIQSEDSTRIEIFHWALLTRSESRHNKWKAQYLLFLLSSNNDTNTIISKNSKISVVMDSSSYARGLIFFLLLLRKDQNGTQFFITDAAVLNAPPFRKMPRLFIPVIKVVASRNTSHRHRLFKTVIDLIRFFNWFYKNLIQTDRNF